MRKSNHLLALLVFFTLSTWTFAQTSKDIQGTWQMVSTTLSGSDWTAKMDSSTHTLIKIITPSRLIFTIYNNKTDSLELTGEGKAKTEGNRYIEMFERSSDRNFPREPVVLTYKIVGNRLYYEGGTKDFHVIEVLKRIE